MRLPLCNVFLDDMDCGIEFTHRKCADTKVCHPFDTLEGRDASPGRLERWACASTMKFNKATRKVLHKIPSTSIARKWVENSPEKKDCGVLVDENLDMTWQLHPGLQENQTMMEGGGSAPLVS